MFNQTPNDKNTYVPSDAASSAYSSLSSASSAVSREFHNFILDMEELIKSTSSASGEELAKAGAKLSEQAVALKKTFDEMSGTVAERARSTAAATNEYAHREPWSLVSAGAVAGLVLGYLLGRRD